MSLLKTLQRHVLTWPADEVRQSTADLKDGLVRVFVPAGALGTGVRADQVETALGRGIDAIALDAGSTDSGAAYLATGRSKYSRDSVKRDLTLLLDAQRRAQVPLLIGSCGTSGGDLALDWTLDIVLEVVEEQGGGRRIALLRSELDKAIVEAKLDAGQVAPLPPARPLTRAMIEACDHIVALLGPEPYMAAVAAGADVVLGGRTTDTAVLAAIPLMLGAGAGPAWHAGKTAECGALCTTHPTSSGVLISVGRDRFQVEPLDPAAACTPYSVSAHMLYENSDPFRLLEPGGILDVVDAAYQALDARRVEVSGSRFEVRPFTHKLEGAGGGPFQTLMLIGIQDPKVLGQLDDFLSRLQAHLTQRTKTVLGLDDAAFDISLRPYGWNAVSSRPVPSDAPTPREVGIVFVATADTQALATQIAKVCNPHFFHFPVAEGRELPTYAFAFSPPEIERGQVYEFKLNHVIAVASPFEVARGELVIVPEKEIAANA